MSGTSLEVNLRRALRRTLQALHSASQDAVTQAKIAEEAQERLGNLQRERQGMALPGADNTAVFLTLITGIVAVYWIDYLLFGSIAEYFAKKTFGDASWIAALSPIAGPLLIICIELVIAAQIYVARERAEDLEGSRWAYRGWLSLGLVLAIVMPSAAVAMNLASFQNFAELPPALKVLQVTTVAIAFVSHIGILFGGRSAHEAKDWLRNRIQVWRLKIRGARASSRRSNSAGLSMDMFQMYKDKIVSGLEAGISVMPGAIGAVPREILRAQFGRDVVEEWDQMLAARSKATLEAANNNGSGNGAVVPPTNGTPHEALDRTVVQ
jgi:MFS family permease